MKRTGFIAKFIPRPPREWNGPDPTPRKPGVVVKLPQRPIVTVEKENALQHLGYMDRVRKLACRRCGSADPLNPRQFCHSDSGKGTGIKTDCRRGWAGCEACHWFVGSTGALGKAGRRAFEDSAAASTRAEILRLGLWPARLPRWSEE